MPEMISIGNFGRGKTTNRLPFNIDNEAFPTMNNFYTWRGRVKRKRGTVFLGQLERQVELDASPNNWQTASFNLVAGAGNLITGASLPSTSSIAPGTISLIVNGATYTEPSTPDGTLLKNAVADPGSTINYASGAITIASGAAFAVTGTFSYYPGLPVMALSDFVSSLSTSNFPVLLAFDTKKSYQIYQTSTSVNFYNTSFYKYSQNPVSWTGDDYQLFYTTNYSSALWATNNVPGFHLVNCTYSAGTGTAAITMNIKSLGVNYTTLVVGDRIWFNEWAGGSTINGLTAEVTDASGAAAGNYVVTFSAVQTVAGTGIGQLLTSSITGQDGIRWYDGDPTNTTGLPTGTNLGWVNFAPPLTASTVTINNLTAAKYYLVGALAILPFKDRLLFFSPWVQTSSGNPIQLQDTVIWSWNGTPYYSSLTPSGETSNAIAYYVDQIGAGGYLSAGISQPIATVSNNEDVLLIGFGGRGRKTRFVYTGDDLQPFLFFNINSELPSSSTFSSIALDKGAIDLGTYGICITDQQSAQRIDVEIPDYVFQVQALNNGFNRVNAIRDFFKEWIYFSYPVNNSRWKFPTQTFLYNYRDNTWGIFYENFTAHGNYRAQNKYSWNTLPFKSWDTWNEPWNSGSVSPLISKIIAGTPQGFVLIKGQGTGEGSSGVITSISNNGGNTQITSVNHCVSASNPLTNNGDYLFVNGCLGTTDLNNQIGKVILVIDADNFVIDLPFPAGTYGGLGRFSRLCQPLLQTKQFPVFWDQGRKCRLSVQKYLLDSTDNGQITVNVYLSQDPDTVWNAGAIVPSTDQEPENNALIYSQILYTCAESTNIGLTPANTNLQMPTAESQFQIWHRFNTSLIGDSVQIGFTLSDDQMRNINYATDEIVLHGMNLTVEPGPFLA